MGVTELRSSMFRPRTHELLNMPEYLPGSKVHGINMGPTWVLSAPVGPHVGPMALAIRAGLLSYAPQWHCLWLVYFSTAPITPWTMYVGTRVPTGSRAVREVARYLWSWITSPYSPVITVYTHMWRCVMVSWLLYYILSHSMMTSSNGNIFRVTGPLGGEFAGRQWIPPHKGQWCGALIFSLICAWING